MLKIIGMLLIMAASVMVGRDIAKGYAKRPLQLRQMMQGLQYLETEIVYACTPLPAAFISVAEKLSGEVRQLFSAIGSTLKENPTTTPIEAWEQVFKNNREGLHFKHQDDAILNSFFSGLGQSHREEQLKQLKLVRELLRSELDKALEDSKKFVRMYNTLGISVGLTVVILLF